MSVPGAAQAIDVRAAAGADIAPVQAIYAHYVRTGFGTFEIEPPDVAEMQARHAAVLNAGMPYLVAERAGRIVGFAYANQFRPRPAYRGTVEDSVYVAESATGAGIGRLLLMALIERCAAMGKRQMLALIGDSRNAASIGAHRACGFATVGVLSEVGHKFDRPVDVVVMQRALG